jgi:enamine deaminase RidA (YjgF/YER057c/UK114 family)
VALAQYSDLFWFPSGQLAADVAARVFQHSTNTLATLWADAGGTAPLANPSNTSADGRLQFWAEEGKYWVHIDSEAFEIAVGAAAESATQQDINDAISGEVTRADAAYAALVHAARHAQGGADPLTVAAIGAEASGTAATAVGVHTAAVDPHGDRTYADGKLAKASNLADLPSASTARGNLGLGGAAVLAVGTSAGTVAAGDDARITGALPASGGTITGSLAVSGHALGEDTPAAHGVAAWCYDPALAVNSTALTNGTLYLVRVNFAAAVSVTKIYWWAGNSGSSPVAGQNEVGLYASDGTRLAVTNVDAAISSAGLKTTTISSQSLAAGAFCWVALLFNASVPPTLTRASGWTGVDAAANVGLTASTLRFATNGAGRTALPASINPASNVGTDIAGPWVAVGA